MCVSTETAKKGAWVASMDIEPYSGPLWRRKSGHYYRALGYFSSGISFNSLYNLLGPAIPLIVSEGVPCDNRERNATSTFLLAYMREYGIIASRCFNLADMYDDKLSGFVKA
ncbi:hypothetical protein AOQ84DRAFT_355740 [Glonium stellatum]|uniref:Cdc24/Scd1 N-terminal domain-containing protein n=1 Tax=Glonium stellatum TaxID=574774 RepID=A0A8E2EW04_9PEZI|nr:hypothetical protein AOQ84DRAFT_355740 [Glonium stellatum]